MGEFGTRTGRSKYLVQESVGVPCKENREECQVKNRRCSLVQEETGVLVTETSGRI